MQETFEQIIGKRCPETYACAVGLDQYINMLPGIRSRIRSWFFFPEPGTAGIYHFSNRTRRALVSMLFSRRVHIVIMHDILPDTLPGRLLHPFFLYLIRRRACGIITHSEAARRLLLSCFSHAPHPPVEAIPCGISIRETPPGEKQHKREQYGYTPEDIVLLICETINRKRGQRKFLELFVQKGAPGVKLAVVGQCQDFGALRLMKRSSAIRYFGCASETVQNDLYALCDAVAVYRETNLGESSSAISAALSFGKPVLTSNHESLREMIRDGGVIFENNTHIIGGILDDLSTRELDLEQIADRCREIRGELTWSGYFHTLHSLAGR